MLVHPLEHGIALTDLSLDLEGGEHTVGLIPELIQEL